MKQRNKDKLDKLDLEFEEDLKDLENRIKKKLSIYEIELLTDGWWRGYRRGIKLNEGKK